MTNFGTPEDRAGRAPAGDHVVGRSLRGRRHRLRKALILTAAALAMLAAAVLTAGFVIRHDIDESLKRMPDPFRNSGDRPAKATGALNLLMVGSDSRVDAGDPAALSYGAQRSDTLILVNIPASRRAINLISIPRDSWIDIPGHGTAKINAALSWGGPPLLVQTVEDLTGIHVDHLVMTDFTGFVAVTDALGGVTIDVGTPTTSTGVINAGVQHFDGEKALEYVQERHGLPGGDFDRIKRQQNWVRAIAARLTCLGTLANPFKLDSTLEKLASSITVDAGFTLGQMQNLAWELRGAADDGLRFTTVPASGTGWSADGQSIVYLDRARADELFKAVRDDTVDQWFAGHPGSLLGEHVN